MPPMIIDGVCLFLQNPTLLAAPSPSPGFVRPAQTKWEIRTFGFQDLLEGALEQSFPFKPIVVIGEATNRMLHGELGLPIPDRRIRQIVIPQFGRLVRLVLPRKPPPPFPRVGPFREAFPPPDIVFADTMVLRQIQRYDPSGFMFHPAER